MSPPSSYCCGHTSVQSSSSSHSSSGTGPLSWETRVITRQQYTSPRCSTSLRLPVALRGRCCYPNWSSSCLIGHDFVAFIGLPYSPFLWSRVYCLCITSRESTNLGLCTSGPLCILTPPPPPLPPPFNWVFVFQPHSSLTEYMYPCPHN